MAEITLGRRARRDSLNRHLTEVLRQFMVYSLVLVGVILFGLPFLWMIRTSVMPTRQVMRFPPEWLPEEITWRHFGEAFQPGYAYSFWGWMWNSFVISAISALGGTASAAITAFSFARLRFRGRDAMFLLVLATMVLPQHVTLVPTYYLFSRLGWVQTYKPLIVPSFFAPAFHVFLLRQFFMTIPRDMDDSAFIDGCSPIGVFLRIHIPMALPALGVSLIFGFTGQWNNFLGPLLYLRDARGFPVALGLRLFQSMYGETRLQALMAATIVSVLPPIMLFFFAQRQLVQGIVITGVKG